MASYHYTNNFEGLTTIKLPAAPTMNQYTIQGQLTLPSLTRGSISNSSVVITVKKNGSVIYTGQAGANGFQLTPTLSPGDVITIIPSSTALVDQGRHFIKIHVQMWEGIT